MVVMVSHDPTFLAAFAKQSLSGRLLVWATRLVVVTRMALLQLKVLLPSYWTLSMMNAVILKMDENASRLDERIKKIPSGNCIVKL